MAIVGSLLPQYTLHKNISKKVIKIKKYFNLIEKFNSYFNDQDNIDNECHIVEMYLNFSFSWINN